MSAAGALALTLHRVSGGAASAWSLRRHRARGAIASRVATYAARGGVIAASTSAVAIAAFAVAVAPARLDDLRGLHAAELAVEVVDASGRWLGVIPATISGGPGRDLHKAIEPQDVPTAWFEILLALEDQNLGTWRTILGQDVARQALSLAMALGDRAGTALGILEDDGRDGQGGASGLAAQLVRGLRELDATGQLSGMPRKLVEMLDGATLYAALGGLDGEDFRRWAATHSTVATGAVGSGLGSEIRGVALGARILFGKDVDDLSLAEQAILASAVKWTIHLAPGEPSAAQLERWGLTKTRAIHGLRVAFGETPAVSAAVAEIEAMPFPRPRLDPALAALVPAAIAFRTAANPEARAANLALDAVTEAHRELVSRYGPGYAEIVAGVTLAIDAADNLAFAARVDAELRRLEAALGGRLMLGLTTDSARPPADIVVALVDDAGHVVRFFSRGPSARWTAGADGTGARHIGSLGKVIAAIALGAAGDTGDTTYCNHNLPDGTVRNAGGRPGFDDCSAPGALMPARHAFGASVNLPIIDALSRVPDSDLRALAADLGFALDPDTPARVAIPLGLISASPADVAVLMQTAALIALDIPDPAPATSFLVAASLRDAATAPGSDTNTPTAHGPVSSAQSAFVADVLAAPLQTGTLAALGDWLRGQAVAFAIGKSGTADGDDGLVDEKWIAATAEWDGRLWTAVVMIGNPDPAAGALGTNLSDALAGLAIEAFRGVVGEGP